MLKASEELTARVRTAEAEFETKKAEMAKREESKREPV